MKHLSLEKLAEIVTSKRKAMKLSQVVTAERAGMNRSLLSRLEQQEFTPSVDQLLALSEVLEFDNSLAIPARLVFNVRCRLFDAYNPSTKFVNFSRI